MNADKRSFGIRTVADCVDAIPRRNPVGVVGFWDIFPKVARASQPWAGGRNPVGIQDWNFEEEKEAEQDFKGIK